MAVYRVYKLDMWADGDGGWTENDRYLIGCIEVEDGEEMLETSILNALRSVKFRDLLGREYSPLTTTNPNIVSIEDAYASGDWFEVADVQNDGCPIYGIQPVEVQG